MSVLYFLHAVGVERCNENAALNLIERRLDCVQVMLLIELRDWED